MSLGIVFKGPEGVVLAADSRVTLNAEMQGPGGAKMILPSFFDNATKLLRVKGQDFVGAVTYGAGAIGLDAPRTAHSFMPEFEAQLTKDGVGRLSVEEFAKRLSDFFKEKWQGAKMPTAPGNDMMFLIGGYDEGAVYGRVFEFAIPSKPAPFENVVGAGQFGAAWGGQREFVDRLVTGADPRLTEFLMNQLSLTKVQKDKLGLVLGQLAAPIPFQFLPLQDCIDLSIFLVRMTSTIQTWQVGLRGVGGAIDVAAITQTSGFTSVQQKTIRGEAGMIRETL